MGVGGKIKSDGFNFSSDSYEEGLLIRPRSISWTGAALAAFLFLTALFKNSADKILVLNGTLPLTSIGIPDELENDAPISKDMLLS